MGRVIAATKPEPNAQATITRGAHALDAQIRAEIEERWQATRPLIRNLKSLRIKLADPALANHSQRPEAEAKETELQTRIDDNVRLIGQQYDLLSVDEAKRMAHEGWPGGKNGLDFAVQLLRDETLGEPYVWPANRGDA